MCALWLLWIHKASKLSRRNSGFYRFQVQESIMSSCLRDTCYHIRVGAPSLLLWKLISHSITLLCDQIWSEKFPQNAIKVRMNPSKHIFTKERARIKWEHKNQWVYKLSEQWKLKSVCRSQRSRLLLDKFNGL